MNWQPFGPALLFCPADRPERFLKAAAAADVVILDLEDGVHAVDRPAARRAIVETTLNPDRTIVRVNPAGSDDHALDISAVKLTPYRTLMLAKTESERQVNALTSFQVIALCETATGVVESKAIASAMNTVGLMWGAEDLAASLGGTSSRTRDGRYRDFARYARSQVLLSARSQGRVAIDSVYLDIPNLEGLQLEVEDGVASGFGAKACIHPSQIPVVRSAYLPSSDEISWAVGVVDAAARSRGVFTYEGKMIDAPLLRQAEQILALVKPTDS